MRRSWSGLFRVCYTPVHETNVDRDEKYDRCLLVYVKKHHQEPNVLISIKLAFGEPGSSFTVLCILVSLTSALFEDTRYWLCEIDVNFFERWHGGGKRRKGVRYLSWMYSAHGDYCFVKV